MFYRKDGACQVGKTTDVTHYAKLPTMFSNKRAWNYKSEHVRVSNRENFSRTYRVDMVGFRILRQY